MKPQGSFTLCVLVLRFVFTSNGPHRGWLCCNRTMWTYWWEKNHNHNRNLTVWTGLHPGAHYSELREEGSSLSAAIKTHIFTFNPRNVSKSSKQYITFSPRICLFTIPFCVPASDFQYHWVYCNRHQIVRLDTDFHIKVFFAQEYLVDLMSNAYHNVKVIIPYFKSLKLFLGEKTRINIFLVNIFRTVHLTNSKGFS